MKDLLQSDPQMKQRSGGRGPGGHRTLKCSGDPSHGERPGDVGSGVDRTLSVSGDLCLGRGLLCDEDTHTQDPHSDDRHTCLHDGDTGTQKVPYRMGTQMMLCSPCPGPSICVLLYVTLVVS